MHPHLEAHAAGARIRLIGDLHTSTLTIEQHFGSSGPLGNVHRFTFEILNFLNFRNFLTWRFFRSSKLLSYKSAKRFEDTCRCRSIFGSKHWVLLSEYWGESALTVDLFSSQYLEGSWPAFWECHSCKDAESQRNLKVKRNRASFCVNQKFSLFILRNPFWIMNSRNAHV